MKLVVVAAVLAAISMGQAVGAQSLPEDFSIITIPNRSDDRLNSSRIVCAAGQIHAADRYVTETYDVKARDAAAFCPAIVAEAVKRGNDADLYARMQPGRAGEELQAVLIAAAGGKSVYANAQGVSKQLTCHLAFDVGYIYGNANPDQAILTDLSAAQIDELIIQCFNNETGIKADSAIWAGARLAQRLGKARSAE